MDIDDFDFNLVLNELGVTRNTKRSCGDCTLCCRLMPVKDYGKLANEKCRHQRQKRCAIYANRPRSCRLWSCAWLADAAIEKFDIPRPDKAHFIIDIQRGHIHISGKVVPSVEIWCDPRRRDAYRHRGLATYLNHVARKGVAALIRYASDEAIVVLAPNLTGTGDFIIIEDGTVVPEDEAKTWGKR